MDQLETIVAFERLSDIDHRNLVFPLVLGEYMYLIPWASLSLTADAVRSRWKSKTSMELSKLLSIIRNVTSPWNY